MSLADEIRNVLRDVQHPGLTAEEIYARLDDAESVDKVRAAVAPLVARGELDSHRQLGSIVRTYTINPRYVPGKAAATPVAREVQGRDTQGEDALRPTRARKPRAEAAPEPRKKREGKPFKAAKRSKRAKPLPKISRRSKRKIKQVIQHAEPIAAQASPMAVFGIRDDGALGIDVADDGEHKGGTVRLDRQDVARLRKFLDTTKPLWS